MNQVESKRLLIILGSYYPDFIGGTENYVRTLAKDMRELGWDTYIMAPSKDDNENSYDYEGVLVYRYPRSVNPTKDETNGKVEPEFLNQFKNIVKENKP